MYELSRNEELILLSIWRLKDDAYGVAIRRNVMEYTKRELHYGSLYNTLEILNRKGYVRLEKGEPGETRGARRKIFYHLTEEGRKALKYVQELQRSAWADIPEQAFKKRVIK
ncbi:PadR family transcriptional regulator [candidate division KSB1 bacterium]